MDSEKQPVKPNCIAIDGPAASGKTTIARLLADRLGYLFFDTGVMYRAVTLAALERGITVEDEERVTRLAEEVEIDIRPPSREDGRSSDVLLDGEDVTWAIRDREVDANVSVVSAFPGVREALKTQQRRIGLQGEVIMVGRDIGTVILPEAELKIYLDASVEERARRRCLERKQRGEEVSYDMILGNMRRRDEIDSTREVAPLKAACDAVRINSDQLSIQEVLDAIQAVMVDHPGEKA